MSENAQNRWIWIIGSCVTFGFVVFIYYLSTLMPQALDREASHGELAPHFTFYKELPNQSVTRVRHAIEGEDLPSPPEQPVVNDPHFHKQVILQAGSYKVWEDADRKRAELALLGLDSKIKEARLQDGTLWYRIEIGPFKSSQSLSYAKQVLTLNSVDFYQKRKKG